PMYVYFDIDEKTWMQISEIEKTLRKKHRKHKAIFQAGVEDEKHYPYQGVLDYVSNTVDPNTGTIEVRGILSNPDQILLPGMFARIRIPYEEIPNAMLIPATAIGFDQTGSYVYVVNEKNVVEHRIIEIGEKVGPMQEVDKGLRDSDRLIIKGLLRARPGRKVTPKEVTITLPEIHKQSSQKNVFKGAAELKHLEGRVPTSTPAQAFSRQPTTLPTTRPNVMEGVTPSYQPNPSQPASRPTKSP
ncbi:MAG TPA: efflux RND transporter periplasmic adaptor subunit, partial [Phycisphaerae bacterium]|nr:efflux RND transporter periplasmic adaptor subunit [Phycisphaerae bacterium]